MLGIGKSGKSWKTTLWGIPMSISGLAMIGALIFFPVTTLPAAAVIAIALCGTGLASGGFGLMTAKDSDVHSTAKEVAASTVELKAEVKEDADTAKAEAKAEDKK